MKAIEQRIGAVLAEKAAMEQKLARMEASYKAEIEALKAVSGSFLPASLLVALVRRHTSGWRPGLLASPLFVPG